MATYFNSSAALKLKPFKASAASILRELSERQVLEDEFLPDPSGFLASRLHGPAAVRIPRTKLNAANRFLFAIMSNEKFRGWINDYQENFLKQLEEDPLAIIDKDQLRMDLAKAMVEFGDAEIIGAILPGNLRPGLGDDPEVVFDVIGNITGRPVLVNQVTSTEMTQVVSIAGGPGRIADVAVEIETLIYAVAAVAVAAVAVAVVVVGAAPRFSDRAILRDVFVDTREMANIAESLIKIGNELRSRGRI